MNILVLSLFISIILFTLIITYFAAKRTKTTSDFYTADGSLTGWQNELAIFVGRALFPLVNPGIVSIPLGFIAAFIGSFLFPEKAKDTKFDEVLVKAHLGRI